MNVNVTIPFHLRESSLIYGHQNQAGNQHDLQTDPSQDNLDMECGFGGPIQRTVMDDNNYQRYNGSSTVNRNLRQGYDTIRDRTPPNSQFSEMPGVNPEAFKLQRKSTNRAGASGSASGPSNSNLDGNGMNLPNGQPQDILGIYEEELAIFEELQDQRPERRGPKSKGKDREISDRSKPGQFPPFPAPGMNDERLSGSIEEEAPWKRSIQELIDKLEEFKEMALEHLSVSSHSRDSPRTFNGPHGYGSLYGSQACGDSRHIHFDHCSSPRVFNKFASVTDAQSGSQVKMDQGCRDQFAS